MVAGTVTFKDNTAVVGVVPVSAGTASLTVTPGVGAHSYVASFTPTEVADAASSSNAVALTIAQSVPTVVIAPSTTRPTYGKAATVTIRVTAAGAVPTGAVAVSVDGVQRGSGTLTNGVATFSLAASLPVGSRSYTATYSGDTNVAAGSATVSLNVQKARPALSFALSKSRIPHTSRA